MPSRIPLTHYGKSKLEAERVVRDLPRTPSSSGRLWSTGRAIPMFFSF